jgi:hypothetical protein
VLAELLTDEEAARYGHYSDPLYQPVLEKVFFLDDDDKALIARRRGHLPVSRTSWTAPSLKSRSNFLRVSPWKVRSR